MNKLRWAQFFWADWANDSALNLCSIPARGLWMALLCLMAQGEPYGTLTVKGRVLTDLELFHLTCPKGTRPRDFHRWLAELKRHGVAHVSQSGAIESPRMIHDRAISLARIQAAHASHETQGNGAIRQNLHAQKRGNGADLHVQTSLFAGVESEADSEADVRGSPLPTPKKEPSKPPAAREASVVSFMARKGSEDDGA